MDEILLVDARSIKHGPPPSASEFELRAVRDYDAMLRDKLASFLMFGDDREEIGCRDRLLNNTERVSHALSNKYISNYGLLMIGYELQRRGYNCIYINADYYDNEQSFINDCIAIAEHVNVVCMSSTTPQYPSVLRNARSIVSSNADCSICIGGPHAFAYKWIQQDGVFDSIIVGYNVKETCDEIEKLSRIKRNDRNYNIDRVSQVVFCKGFVQSQLAYNLIPVEKISDTLLYTIASMGCPNRCSYCSEHYITNGICRFSFKQCFQNIEYIVNGVGIKMLHFADSDFLINTKWLSMFLDKLEHSQIRACYSINTSPKSLYKPELIPLLKRFVKLGLIEILIGVENFSQSVLRFNKKDYDTHELYKTLYHIRAEVDVPIVSFYSLVGLPGETHVSIDDNLSWWDKFSNSKLFDFTFPKFFVPYPGTDVFNFPESYNIKIHTYDWNYYHRWALPRPIEIVGMNDDSFLNELIRIHSLNNA